jgi:hypothetical protein
VQRGWDDAGQRTSSAESFLRATAFAARRCAGATCASGHSTLGPASSAAATQGRCDAAASAGGENGGRNPASASAGSSRGGGGKQCCACAIVDFCAASGGLQFARWLRAEAAAGGFPFTGWTGAATAAGRGVLEAELGSVHAQVTPKLTALVAVLVTASWVAVLAGFTHAPDVVVQAVVGFEAFLGAGLVVVALLLLPKLRAITPDRQMLIIWIAASGIGAAICFWPIALWGLKLAM